MILQVLQEEISDTNFLVSDIFHYCINFMNIIVYLNLYHFIIYFWVHTMYVPMVRENK